MYLYSLCFQHPEPPFPHPGPQNQSFSPPCQLHSLICVKWIVLFLIQFAIYGYAFATLISIGAVVQEEITVRRYHRWTDVGRLLLYCLAEHFPYRQINMWWRLRGMWQYLRGNVAWEKSERSAFATTTK